MWREIPGFDGRYQISDDGLVLSTKGRLPKIIRGSRSKAGRRLVMLWKGNQYFPRYVAPLVLEAFGSPRPDGLECCHIDGDCSHDHIDNLRWDTHQANMHDKVLHGTFVAPPVHYGEKHHNAKLTLDDIRCIRAEPPFVGDNAMLARCFGVSKSTIARIRRGDSWATAQ